MKKYFIELQDEPKACGAYCIYMILRHYGIHVELKSIKDKTRMDQNGISIKGMLECLKEYQVEAKAFTCSLNDIKEQVKLPCILHLSINNLGHYVVLYEIKDDEYIIGDPQKGLITMYEDELEKFFSSYMISIMHVGRVEDEKEQSYLQFIKETFQNYSYEIRDFLFNGLLISILSFIAAFLFQIIIDDFNYQTSYFYMVSLAVAYLLTQMLKITKEKYQAIELLELSKALAEDYFLSSILHLNEISHTFLNQEKGQIHSQILSLYQLSTMNITLFENVLLNGITMIIYMFGMIYVHSLLAIIVGLFLMIIALYLNSQVNIVKRMSQSYLEKYYHHHQSLLEWIETLPIIKRFHIVERKGYHHDSYIHHALMKIEKEKKTISLNTIVSYMTQICFFVILIVGLWFYSKKQISLGQLVMFYMLLNSLIPSFLSLVSLFFEYHSMKFIYERYKNYRIEKVEKEKIKETIRLIHLDNVSFSYGYREAVFNHIDLIIDKTLYIKGNTGSGKSTLLHLLLGEDLRYSGDIYYNNQELRNINLDSLYEHVGYECQTPIFFQASLYDNLLSDDDEKIQKLLKSFGYLELYHMRDMLINVDGSPLSLGQRQVIALVRLFLKDYDVYILDEVFSHMDQRSAGKIYRYIVKNYSDKIIIMVNHQSKLVNRNDDYVIMDNGKLIKKDD